MPSPIFLCLRAALFATFVLALVGCSPESSKSGSSPPPPLSGSGPAPPAGGGPAATDNKPPTPAKTTPDVKLTAEELYQESRKDGNFLIAKHAGKLVELTGVVHSAGLDFSGSPFMFLRGGKELQYVNCPLSERNPGSKAFPGQTVTLWGTVPSSSYDPKPFVWNIKSVTGSEPPKVTAEQFKD